MRSTKKGEGEEVAAETESVAGVVIEVERREEIEAIETEVEDIDIEEYSNRLHLSTKLNHIVSQIIKEILDTCCALYCLLFNLIN